MTRRSLSNLLSNEEQNLLEVWSGYDFLRALLREEESRVGEAFTTGDVSKLSRYVGKKPEELTADFEKQALELGRMTSLALFACTEAALRIDLIERVTERKKDKVSRAFRRIHQRQGIEKIRLEEDILDAWNKYSPNATIKRAVTEFKGALNLRHWLAHGRYWKVKLGRVDRYRDPLSIFFICRALLQAASLLPL